MLERHWDTSPFRDDDEARQGLSKHLHMDISPCKVHVNPIMCFTNLPPIKGFACDNAPLVALHCTPSFITYFHNQPIWVQPLSRPIPKWKIFIFNVWTCNCLCCLVRHWYPCPRVHKWYTHNQGALFLFIPFSSLLVIGIAFESKTFGNIHHAFILSKFVGLDPRLQTRIPK